jgi:hypothetical protein
MDVVRLVVALLIPLPLTVFLLVTAMTTWVGLFVPAAVFGAIATYMLWRALGLRTHLRSSPDPAAQRPSSSLISFSTWASSPSW